VGEHHRDTPFCDRLVVQAVGFEFHVRREGEPRERRVGHDQPPDQADEDEGEAVDQDLAA